MDASTFLLTTFFKLIECFVLYVFEFVLYCLTTRIKIVKLGHRVAEIWLCKDNHRFFETKDRVLEVNNWIPTTVSWIFVIFQYVIADIILYSKSVSSAETVKFWTRTSSERETPATKQHNLWINPINPIHMYIER